MRCVFLLRCSVVPNCSPDGRKSKSPDGTPSPYSRGSPLAFVNVTNKKITPPNLKMDTSSEMDIMPEKNKPDQEITDEVLQKYDSPPKTAAFGGPKVAAFSDNKNKDSDEELFDNLIDFKNMNIQEPGDKDYEGYIDTWINENPNTVKNDTNIVKKILIHPKGKGIINMIGKMTIKKQGEEWNSKFLKLVKYLQQTDFVGEVGTYVIKILHTVIFPDIIEIWRRLKKMKELIPLYESDKSKETRKKGLDLRREVTALRTEVLMHLELLFVKIQNYNPKTNTFEKRKIVKPQKKSGTTTPPREDADDTTMDISPPREAIKRGLNVNSPEKKTTGFTPNRKKKGISRNMTEEDYEVETYPGSDDDDEINDDGQFISPPGVVKRALAKKKGGKKTKRNRKKNNNKKTRKKSMI